MQIASALCLGLVMVLSAGCSKKDDNPVAPTPPTPTDIEQVIHQAGTVQKLSEDKDVVTDADTMIVGAFRQVTESHDAARNIQEITYLGLNDDVIWTGNLIKGAKVHQFVYEPVVGVARNPVTLSINLEGSGSGTAISQVVNDPKLSTVRQGISDLLGRAIQSGTTYAARAQFDKKQVYCESQLNLAVGADLKYGAGSLGTTFDWASTTRKNKIIAKYQQLYYTIDMDTPATPAAVFSSSNTLDGIRAAIPAGSCPVYVAGVTYGMMALTFVETDYSESELNASLDAAYSGGFLDVEIRSGLTKRQVLENSSIKTIVYGGSSAGLQQIYTGYQGFTEVVSHSIQLGISSPGVPLIYKFRHLCDNSLANVTLTSQYSLTRLIRLQQLVRLTIEKFVCEWANDDCGDDVAEIDRIYVWVNASQQATGGAPVNYHAQDLQVYTYESGGYGHQMNDGDEHPINMSADFTFDTEAYDYEKATIRVRAKVRDWDGVLCSDDWAENSLSPVLAANFGSNPHQFWLYGNDFTMRFEVKIELANAPQKPFAARR
jgi:thiol-activated cytolysin